MEKKYINNPDAVIKWARDHGGFIGFDRSGFGHIAAIAADCMSVYNPTAGAPEVVGWFPFSSIDGMKTQPEGCAIVQKEGTAAIGIRTDILTEAGRNYAVIVGLHQLTHLSAPEHDERFVSRYESLLYRYFSRRDKLKGRTIGETKHFH